MSRLLSLLLILCLGNVLVVADDHYGPSTVSPDTALAVNDFDLSRRWVDELSGLDLKVRAQIQSLEQDPATIDEIRGVNEAQENVFRMSVIARRLVDLREPAGADFQARAEAAGNRLKKISEKIRTDASYRKMEQKFAREFQTEIRNREKKLGKIKSLVKQGDLEEAEQALLVLTTDLAPGALWFEASQHQQMLQAFESERRGFQQTLSEKRRKLFEESLRKVADTQAPDTEGLIRDFERAANALKTAPTTNFRGAELTGPELASRLQDSVLQVQIQGLRHGAMHFYLKGTRDLQSEQAVESFRERFPTFVEEFAKADAARLKDREEILRVYSTYLRTLAPVAARSFSDVEVDRLQGALGTLANHPEIKDEVEQYRLATEGLLTWRRRVADLRIKGSKQSMEPLEIAITKFVRESSDRETSWKWSSQPGQVADPLPDLVPVLGRGVADKPVVMTRIDVSRVPDRMARSPMRQGAYATFAVPPVSPEVIAEFRRELLATDGRHCLTLRAEAAIWSLEWGCVDEVGGIAGELKLEPLAPALLKLTQEQPQYLTQAPLLLKDYPKLERQVIVSVQVKPTWIRYRHHVFMGR